jgi:hypothetical protein
VAAVFRGPQEGEGRKPGNLENWGVSHETRLAQSGYAHCIADARQFRSVRNNVDCSTNDATKGEAQSTNVKSRKNAFDEKHLK